jgi:type I restriction enzyme R subunit
MTIHTERRFEEAIEHSLLTQGGYAKTPSSEFDPSLALFSSVLVGFLEETQPDQWARLAEQYGDDVERRVVATVARAADQFGLLHVLRHGVTDRGIKLELAFFKPASGLNPETLRLYGLNRLTIARQVHYSPRNPAQSVDVVLALNGLPVATAELKSQFTRQTYAHAIQQYKERDPRDPLFGFKRRALVHFAVDPDLVSMTSRLEGPATRFLPFNKGRDRGAGNPDNPQGYKTAYLWQEVWARDCWLDILARFVHLQVETEKDPDTGREQQSEKLVFPRYHQLDAVTRLIEAAKEAGPGRNYLIQHSAGSGKSNSIGWLAHRLASLHGTDDRPVFDGVVVITDRRVLDKQLQDVIYQFEHQSGVVERITGERAAKGAELSTALNAGKRIVVVTLHSFGSTAMMVDSLEGRRFAVIVDEAHSSQTGEGAATMKRILSGQEDEQEAEAEETNEDRIIRAIQARGPQPNLSFFAFTATPKKRTLELFGARGPDGLPQPFHEYSMRQAIEEGFILDVLKHYTTYRAYYRLEKSIEDDPEVDKRRALRAIARFMSLHPHNLAQKTEVMVEHFRAHTRHKIGGRAKAMVVTRSRLHAVRYFQHFRRYLKKNGYHDMGVLVAFSGTVIDPEGGEHTEPGMNGFGERELPDRFARDDAHVLIVAEKYQTGFDQPLLHTMYVDKKLDGINAVQTLSRLNRTHPGKDDTFILDFVNEAEEIREAFKPFYEVTEIDAPTDPNQIYTLRTKLDEFQYYWWQEVEGFAEVFYRPKQRQAQTDQARLHAFVDPAVSRFKDEPNDERREAFRSLLVGYLRMYALLSQMVDYLGPEFEKLYSFGRLLRTKLPRREREGELELDGDVALAYYRLSITSEGDRSLQAGNQEPVSGAAEVGTSRPKDDQRSPLSEIISTINDRFGTDWKSEDRLLFDQVVEDLTQDDELGEQARANDLDNFKHVFDPKALDAFIQRMERNNGIASQVLNNRQMLKAVMAAMMREVYHRARLDPEWASEIGTDQ